MQTFAYVKKVVSWIKDVTGIPLTSVMKRVLSVLVILIIVVSRVIVADFLVRLTQLALYCVKQYPQCQLIPHQNRFLLSQ